MKIIRIEIISFMCFMAPPTLQGVDYEMQASESFFYATLGLTFPRALNNSQIDFCFDFETAAFSS